MAAYLEKRLLLREFGLRGDLVVIGRVRRGTYLVSIAAYDRKKQFRVLTRLMSPAQIEAVSVPRAGASGLFRRSHKAGMRLRVETLSAA